MRALEPEVINAVWEAVKHLIPQPVDNHPSAATAHGFLTGSASRGSSSG